MDTRYENWREEYFSHFYLKQYASGMFSEHTLFTDSPEHVNCYPLPWCHLIAADTCSSVVFLLLEYSALSRYIIALMAKCERGAAFSAAASLANQSWSGTIQFVTCPWLHLRQEKYCGTSGLLTLRTKEKISSNFSFRINFTNSYNQGKIILQLVWVTGFVQAKKPHRFISAQILSCAVSGMVGGSGILKVI